MSDRAAARFAHVKPASGRGGIMLGAMSSDEKSAARAAASGDQAATGAARARWPTSRPCCTSCTWQAETPTLDQITNRGSTGKQATWPERPRGIRSPGSLAMPGMPPRRPTWRRWSPCWPGPPAGMRRTRSGGPGTCGSRPGWPLPWACRWPKSLTRSPWKCTGRSSQRRSRRGCRTFRRYLPREHDAALARMVTAAAQGRSEIAVLVGGSSTGKTRACWEALALLRDQPGPWRLWHPIDPSRPDAALRDLPGIGPRTVVWLNEAQFYLDPAEAGLGEQVAAGLRELLRDPGRAPVLVLATLWPQFWDTLTARPAGGDDRHAQARDLLAGHDIAVPAAFTPAQMRQLTGAEDPRLALGRSCGQRRRAGDPVPGRGAGAAGPVPQRPARRAGADRRRDGCPPPGHGSGPAAGLPGSRRAGIPDRRPSGTPSARTGWNRPWPTPPSRARAPAGR